MSDLFVKISILISTYLYAYVYVCMYVYIYSYTRSDLCGLENNVNGDKEYIDILKIHMFKHREIPARIADMCAICVYACIYLCIHTHIHIYIYIYIYIYTYIFIYTYIYMSAREASLRRVFDPYAPLFLNLYHYLEQTLHFRLAPENPI